LDTEFTHFLESLALGALITDTSGTIVYSNQFLEPMFGYEHGGLVGQSVEALIPDEFRELHERNRTQYSASLETRLMGAGRDLLGRRKDGSVFPVEVGLSPIRIRNVMYTVAFVTDITRRKHAEQRSILQRDVALILSKADSIQSAGLSLLETIGSSLGWRLGALWLVDAESRLLRNAVFWRATGFEAPDFEAASRRRSFRMGEGLLGRVWENGEPEWASDLAIVKGYLRTEEARANGLRSALELPILVGTQTLGVIEFFSHEVRPPDEGLIEIAAAVASQVGQFLERKRSERALGIFQERYRSLFENAVFGIIRTTASGEILDANPALVAMLGYDTADEVLRLNCHRDVYKDPAERQRFIEGSRSADRFDGFEVEWKTKTGKTIQVRLSGRIVRDEKRTLAGFEAIVEDITQRKSLEQQYRQAQKMEAIGRLAGGVAHDFNNLLTIISVSTDSLLEPNGDQELLRHTANEIVRAAEHGASLVRQLMAFSRTQPRAMQPVNLNDVIRSCQRMLQILAGEDIRFEWNLQGGECLVAVDSIGLEQILMNLVTNSRDAMAGGGIITISTALVDIDEQGAFLYVGLKPAKHVRLCVTDTGHGIPPEIQPHIFEPFFTTKGEDGRGTGLGLSTVYGIVHQHEGHIRCDSASGQGAAFMIMLPAAERPAAAAVHAPAPLRVNPATETVLLVEDEPALRASVRRILEQTGYKVVVASNGVDALKAAEERHNTLDLLLTDIVLPRMRGTELAKRLLESHPRMRVLYMSGYSEETVSLDSLHFIPKPFKRENLIRKIREVLDL
jgi:PAS domain S-box-containing protein